MLSLFSDIDIEACLLNLLLGTLIGLARVFFNQLFHHKVVRSELLKRRGVTLLRFESGNLTLKARVLLLQGVRSLLLNWRQQAANRFFGFLITFEQIFFERVLFGQLRLMLPRAVPL